MTIKKITLGACLLLTGSVLAQDATYTVKQGDTLSGIASRFGANSKEILQANRLQSADKLKLGQKLTIPQAAKAVKKSSFSGNVYNVKQGDTDISIAKKLGITAKELRVANMGTNWTKLQIGQALIIPTASGWFHTMANHAANQAKTSVVAQSKPEFKLASSIKAAPQKPKVIQRTYTVRNGDNDWIIAKRVGIKPSQLRTLNPGVKWASLQIGTVLKVPGTKTVSASGQAEKGPHLPPLRSRYAVITGESVAIRRGPSTRFPSLTQVPRGTRVLVLDHEGSWYKLRFPKGTEAWVRADYLAPTKAPQILAMKSPAKKSIVKPSKKPTLVASRTTTRSSTRKSRNERNVTTRRPAKDNGRPLVVASGNGSSLLDKASSFLGVRYRYGAASRSATDCSGFTTQVFKSQGVKLPRTAREQSSRGQKVTKGELKPGDLVFFKTRGSRVSHVGIYKGNGKFIHASSGRGKVMESSLNEGYYQRRFAGARRVIANKPAPKNTVVAKKDEAPKEKPAEPETKPADDKPTTPPDQKDNS